MVNPFVDRFLGLVASDFCLALLWFLFEVLVFLKTISLFGDEDDWSSSSPHSYSVSGSEYKYSYWTPLSSITAVYNSILFSSPLVLLSNLDLRGFCFLGFIFVSPH